MGLLAFGSGPEFDEHPDFARWFALYPVEHRVAKGAARREWKKLRPNQQQVAQMMSVLAQQKASAKWRAGYVPSPANYLRDERFDDYVEPAQSNAVNEDCQHTPRCHNRSWCKVTAARLRGEA